ncbi:delta-aminolevulinic acid dehydratase [Paenibacillus sp. GCM10027627]|uniref:delta-aminolevulinic acid dehydratase n=1 Tax=unclassified Paenibacillus TaxID=185978 RepID=UPI0036320A28
MNKSEFKVALVCGPNSDLEAVALRASLEYFGARVFPYWIGRPYDLIDVLSGEGLYEGTDHIVFSFHGDEGKLVMPELGEEVYEEDEPREDFGPEQIVRFAKLKGKVVLGNGCTLGENALAQAFLDGGCTAYIGPNDYVDGNSALMFATRFYYELIQNKKTVEEAFALAKAMDEETSMYQLFTSTASA